MCSLLSRVQLFETPWTVTCQVPLSMGFSWQGYWRGLPFLPPGDLPDSGIKPTSPVSPAIQADSFTAELSGIYLRVAGKIPWSEEPGGLQSMGPQRLRHDWVTNSFYTHLQVCVRVYYYHQFFSNLQNTSVFFVFFCFSYCSIINAFKHCTVKEITILIKNWSVVIKNWSWRESECVCVRIHAQCWRWARLQNQKSKRKAIRVSVCLYYA